MLKLTRETKVRIALRKHNGMSSDQVAEFTGLKVLEVRPILCDMVRNKTVKKHNCKHCGMGVIYELFQ